MSSQRSFFARARAVLLFDVPIRFKFLLFCSSVAVWVGAIGVLGAWSTPEPALRWTIIGMTTFFLGPLWGFAYVFARSVSRPVGQMTRQMEELAEGRGNADDRLDVRTADEIGALSHRFNHLLDTVQAMKKFKKVIEEDLTVEAVYQRLGVEFRRHGLDRFRVYEVAGPRNRLRLAHSSDDPEVEACSKEIFVDCNGCRAKRTGDVVCSATFPRICPEFALEDAEHLCVPLIIGGATGGVVQFLFEKHGSDSERARAALAATLEARTARPREFLREACAVIEAKRLTQTLRESTLRDAMTGLYNRRFLDEYAENLVALTQRRKTALGVLMCDIDFFKQVNDLHGHDAGDAVLKEAAGIIARAVRTSDIVVRFGGEEFLAVLQDAGPDTAMEVAERVRAAVEEATVRIPGGTVRRTISIGVAEFPSQAATFWQAIKYADTALYRAKESGRNRVVCFAPEMWTEKEI